MGQDHHRDVVARRRVHCILHGLVVGPTKANRGRVHDEKVGACEKVLFALLHPLRNVNCVREQVLHVDGREPEPVAVETHKRVARLVGLFEVQKV